MKRKSFSRQSKKRLLILCEDKKSSCLYFDSFKKDEEYRRKLKVVFTVEHPEDYSPLGLVKNAIERRKIAEDDKNPYDEIWVVFDKDKHRNIPQAYSLARRKGINIAISIICFEFWVLLHYGYTTMQFNKCDDIIKHIKKYYFSEYEKCENCFDELRDKINDAIKYAKQVEKSVKIELERGKKNMNFQHIQVFTN